MARNSHSIARHFNAAMESIGRAVRPKSQSLWVYQLTEPSGGWQTEDTTGMPSGAQTSSRSVSSFCD